MLGSGVRQETLYHVRSESCKRKLRKTSPCGPPGMAIRVFQPIDDTPVPELQRLSLLSVTISYWEADLCLSFPIDKNLS